MPAPSNKNIKGTKTAKKLKAKPGTASKVKSSTPSAGIQELSTVKLTTPAAGNQNKRKQKKDETKKLGKQKKQLNKPLGGVTKKAGKKAATANSEKIPLNHKENLPTNPKIHPEVGKLVKILTSTIRELSAINDDQNKASAGEPWGLKYFSEYSLSNVGGVASSTCNNAFDCSCCAHNFDADYNIDNCYSCSDDETDYPNDMSDDTGSCDEISTDELDTDGYDGDSDSDNNDESCGGCSQCMPNVGNHEEIEPQSNVMNKTEKLPIQKTQKARKIKQPLKKKAEKNIKTGVKNPSTNKATISKKPKVSTPAPKKIASLVQPKTAAAAYPTKFKAQNNIPKKTNPYLEPPTMKNTKAAKSLGAATSSSGCFSWDSRLSASSMPNSFAAVSKPKAKAKSSAPSTSKVRKSTTRSVGVGCCLPNANSTLRDSSGQKLWRY